MYSKSYPLFRAKNYIAMLTESFFMSMTYFLISFSDGNSSNPAVSSCQNAITFEKPYKIALKVKFFGVHYLWLIESVFIKLSIGQEA